MTTRNLEHEFFTKVKGWEKLRTGMWASPDKYYRNDIPPISTSWDAFHEWVVPELDKIEITFQDLVLYHQNLGIFFIQDKTPQRALEWAMKELR